jgi:hypothetical protein
MGTDPNHHQPEDPRNGRAGRIIPITFGVEKNVDQAHNSTSDLLERGMHEKDIYTSIGDELRFLGYRRDLSSDGAGEFKEDS